MPPLAPEDLDHVLALTAPLWEEMRGQRLFITGGTGFFGCWLVETFAHINRVLGLKAHATVLTRSPEAFTRKCSHLATDSAITLLEGDIRTFQAPAGEFPYVIHAATEASAKQLAEQPLEMLSTILDGTTHLLRFAAARGCRKLLFTSSGAIYGPQPPDVPYLEEDRPAEPDPANVYAEGKLTAELLCAMYAGASLMQVKIARCFAFVGPHLPLDAHFAIGNFIGDALAGRPIQIAGDGSAVRSYLYASDLAVWLWTMLFRAPSTRPYNVGSPEAVTIRRLAEIVAATIEPGSPIEVAMRPTDGPPHRYVPSTERAHVELDLAPSLSLEQAILRTALWYRLESQVGKRY